MIAQLTFVRVLAPKVVCIRQTDGAVGIRLVPYICHWLTRYTFQGAAILNLETFVTKTISILSKVEECAHQRSQNFGSERALRLRSGCFLKFFGLPRALCNKSIAVFLD